MAKSFVRIEKIKNMGTLKARWNHDINKEFRKEHVSNADSSKIDSNDILVPCTDDDGFEISYDVAVKNRIKNLKQSDGRKIRNNAVMAYDIVLEFGDADDIEAEGINVDEWEKRSLEWLKETFNVAGDGKENVLSVVCHKDESSPHIHAIVSPVDERGCLCARSFTNGSAALSMLQDTYAEKLADLGIERGIKGSSAHHKSNRRYNAEKAIAAKIPEPEPGQSAEEYLMVYQAELEARAVKHKVQMDKMERKLRAEMDEDRLLQREAINEEFDNMKVYYDIEEEKILQKLNTLKRESEDCEEKIRYLKSEKQQLEAEKNELEKEIYNLRDMQICTDLYNHQQEVMLFANRNNPELAEQIVSLQDIAEREYDEYTAAHQTETQEEERENS